jgi:hypothetical protein
VHRSKTGPPTSASGHKQTSRPAWTLSALPPKADIRFQSSINNTVDSLIGFSRRSRLHANEEERVTRKPRVVTFRLDQATWDWMRELVPYTRYGNASSFIREGIDLLLKREEEQPSGWTAGRPRRG